LEQDSSSNSGQKLVVTVAGDEASPRLDRVLAVRRPELSRSRLKGLILAAVAALWTSYYAAVERFCRLRGCGAEAQ